MKRSEINGAIRRAIKLLEENHLKLPAFAYWTMDQWRANADRLGNIKEVMLGWDVTDFASGDFLRCGSVLFTLRNGSLSDRSAGTPYAEKYIFQLHDSRQEIPFHYHNAKCEDIINRGGGVLMLELYHAGKDNRLDRRELRVKMDGLIHTLPPGTVLELPKGASITLEPGIFHRFWAKKGEGDLIAGEVSSVNDDRTDNVFLVSRDRFSTIEEDEEIRYPLCNEYHTAFTDY